MHKSLPNTIDYVEMPSQNLAETKRFFSALFGWTFQDYGPDYAAFDDGRMTGGFFASEKTSNVESGAPLVVFYHRELEKMQKQAARSEEHTSELQSLRHLVCRLLLEKKK